ncbi:M23 family metallopeptidase [Sulfitobacter delicatus]|uniref:Murein DD-endopeptidase MepM and murein hydrolase activator NlpD, contain LysM domain n=1 Tax=Sulfitobacter delicatus TaxID=218672 RepID=A0A1G7KQQ2_9RHOB|nr:M23 family metallopeptidase [Sulfitobacter delicatus]SDF39404.1 Murein DD-endopeptidase MepM and murein hydrolase activator NlpD, contain LysM domain [Sulfitobacter delicatus]
MRHPFKSRPTRLTLLAGTSVILLAGCEGQPLDFDMRSTFGDGFSTAEAARGPLAERPKPDARGVISYPNYQVAVAQRGDTLKDVAARVGADRNELARYNGIDLGVPLRQGEIIALPRRVAEPAPGSTGGNVDITSLAGNAIDRVPATPGVQTQGLPPANTSTPAPQPAAPKAKEPVRHRVERGETAYTVSRLYNVPVKALAEWNGLGPDFAIREGQFLLIPVEKQAPPRQITPAAAPAPQPVEPVTTAPGAGSPTPTPPSAAKPLPQDDTAKPTPPAAAPAEPVADVGKPTAPAKATKMIAPVQGSIIREYAKGKNEGINIKGAPGASVKAADGGTVAAITKSAEGIPIVVVRHPNNLLTVYANVAGVKVAKGDSVSRGQQIAVLRDGADSHVHFEVRNGFESVDPTPYIQ